MNAATAIHIRTTSTELCKVLKPKINMELHNLLLEFLVRDMSNTEVIIKYRSGPMDRYCLVVLCTVTALIFRVK